MVISYRRRGSIAKLNSRCWVGDAAATFSDTSSGNPANLISDSVPFPVEPACSAVAGRKGHKDQWRGIEKTAEWFDRSLVLRKGQYSGNTGDIRRRTHDLSRLRIMQVLSTQRCIH